MSLADLNAIRFNDLPITQEREENSSFTEGRQNNSLGDITNRQLGLTGDLGENSLGDIKDLDFFHFTVSQPTQFNAVLRTVVPEFQSAVRLNLFTDFNNDGVNNDGVPGDGLPDLLPGNRVSVGNLERSLDRLSPVNQIDPKNQLAPGEYFLAVSNINIGEDQPIEYEVKLEAPELETAQLNLTIGEISPERERGQEVPVRFEAQIGDQVFQHRFETDFERTVLPVELDPRVQKTDITIRAFRLNEDGSETRIDLNSRIGEQELQLTFDSLTGKLFKQGTGIRVNEGQGVRVIARNETGDAAGEILPGFIGLNVTYDTTAGLGEPAPAPDPGDLLFISGTQQDDVLTLDDRRQFISGLGGNDEIDAGGGRDILKGAGSRSDSSAVGKGEIDRLTGGAGRDTFQLHTNNGLTRLYDDGRRLRNRGACDFAVIEDFVRGQDTIAVAGNRDEYFISSMSVRGVAEGDGIFHDSDGNGRLTSRDELIAITNGVDNLLLGELTFIETPLTLGTSKAERIQGTGQDGILVGRGKRDVLDAKGGDDIVLGGKGNDVLIGSSGDDLLDGGKGSDKYRGKAGGDTFVIAAGQGRDRILDFKDGVDVIGLAKGLAFEDLSLAQRGKNTVISLGEEALVVVKGVATSQLSRENFVAVAYTRYEGIKVPVALGTDPTAAL